MKRIKLKVALAAAIGLLGLCVTFMPKPDERVYACAPFKLHKKAAMIGLEITQDSLHWENFFTAQADTCERDTTQSFLSLRADYLNRHTWWDFFFIASYSLVLALIGMLIALNRPLLRPLFFVLVICIALMDIGENVMIIQLASIKLSPGYDTIACWISKFALSKWMLLTILATFFITRSAGSALWIRASVMFISFIVGFTLLLNLFIPECITMIAIYAFLIWNVILLVTGLLIAYGVIKRGREYV